jgi:hypothetical protein
LRRWQRWGEEVEAQRSPPGEAVEVDGVLRGRRRQRALGEAVKVEGEAIERHRGRAL